MENIAELPVKGEKTAKKGMTAQTRLIIAGLAVSTAFIMGVAGFSVYSIDKNMNSAF